MATDPKEGKLIYHLTAIDNLENIFRIGLQPRASLDEFMDVADGEIISRRKINGLNKYVPFHFFAGNPFDGRVQKENKNTEFIIISLKRDFAKSMNFKIIKSHPLALNEIKLYDYDDGIEKIDWESIKKRDYSDHKCKEHCMAECLTSTVVYAKDFSCIWVKNQIIQKRVINLWKEIYNTAPPFFVTQNINIFVK